MQCFTRIYTNLYSLKIYWYRLLIYSAFLLHRHTFNWHCGAFVTNRTSEEIFVRRILVGHFSSANFRHAISRHVVFQRTIFFVLICVSVHFYIAFFS